MTIYFTIWFEREDNAGEHHLNKCIQILDIYFF